MMVSKKGVAMEKVYLSRCRSYSLEEVRAAIRSILDRMDFKLPHNKTVFLKPNIMTQNRPGQHTVTHFSLVAVLCELLSANGCRVQIGDSIAFYQTGLTRKAFQTTGMQDVARRYGAELIALDEDKLVSIPSGYAPWAELFIPRSILDADLVFNIPKLKTHSGLRFSGAIKNMFGVLPGGYKQKIHMWTANDFELSDVFLDLERILRPALHLMDGVYGLDGGPTAFGKPAAMGYIIASRNAAALDTAACRMIGYQPEDIPALARALDHKLISDFENIEVHLPDTIERVRDIKPVKLFKHLKKGPVPLCVQKKGAFILHTPVVPIIKTERCSRCWECLDFCTPGAVSLGDDSYPGIDSKRCIQCYTCLAACREGAFRIKSSLINKLIRAVRCVIRV